MLRLFFALLLALSFAAPVMADTITLRVTEDMGGYHKYFYELLTSALEADGHAVNMISLGVVPFKRARDMLETGETTIHWYHRARAEDLSLVPVPVGITNNLIGKRVLVIKRHMASAYAGVATLDDFRDLHLVGGFGKGWYDVRVWQANKLGYMEKDGDWRSLFPMLASGNRGVDYLSRGVIEVADDIKLTRGLEIEPRLLLSYDSDFWFFLTPAAKSLKPVIEKALIKARHSGLMDAMVQKHYGADFEKLGVDRRTVIRLKSP